MLLLPPHAITSTNQTIKMLNRIHMFFFIFIFIFMNPLGLVPVIKVNKVDLMDQLNNQIKF